MTVQTAVDKPIVVTDASFTQDVLAAPLPTVVDFWAPWCPPCRVIGPILNELAAEYAGRLTIAKLNTDEHQRSMVELGVQGLPTLIIFKDGREVERLVGARPKRYYQERFEALLPGDDGILRSAVFPGLWLDPAALMRGDVYAVLAVVQRGLNSPEHADFVAQLERARIA